jgi:hypothetical protein
MKKSTKIILFTVLTVVLLWQLWIALYFMTEEPRYAHNSRDNSRVNPHHDVVLSSKDALEDVEKFAFDLTHYHPKPFAFISEEQFNRQIEKNKEAIAQNETITTLDLSLMLSELTGLISDSHTSVEIAKIVQRYALPVDVVYVDGRFFNIRQEGEIPYMAEIVSVNSMDSETLYDLVGKYINTPTKSGIDRFVERNFSNYIPLILGYEADYKVSYKDDEKISTIPVELERFYEKKRFNGRINDYVFEYNDLSIPVLELNSFSGDNDELNVYMKTVDTFFQENKDAKQIAIDIRNNGGGSDGWGRYVLNYFLGDTYKGYDHFDIYVTDYTRAYYTYQYQMQFYRLKIPSIFWSIALNIIPDCKLYRDILNAEDGEVISVGEMVFSNPVQSEKRYKGKTFLLTSGETGSAAIGMASLFKHNDKNGCIVGQETNHPESFAGNFSVYTLPHSGVGYSLPCSYSIAPDGAEDERGVIPDYEVKRTLDAFEDGRDPELEFILTALNQTEI